MATTKASKKAQTTLTFNEIVDDIGSCEVTATVTIWGAVTINSVRRNSDYRSVSLPQDRLRDLANLARWYADDAAFDN